MSLTPSPEQQAILDLGLDTIRIRAGAGTGKTTTVAMLIANLVRNHQVEPEQILGITFTNKAAAELAERVKAFLGPEVDEGRQAEVHTYHGFAAQILAEFGALAGVDSRVRVITPTFSRQLLTETYHHTSYEHIDITNTRGVDKIRTLADRMGDHLLTVADLLPHVDPGDEVWPARREMLETLAQYEQDKRRLGIVDYSDLVTLSVALVSEHAEIASEIRSRYRAVVLDEYQDTNPAQRVLLTTIFGAGFPVIAVGDEDQTIYEWRGASAENFEQFAGHFSGPRGAVHDRALTLNRRSAPAILEVANQIRRKANPDAEDLVSSRPDAVGEVVTYWAGDAVAEADWIARRFEALHETGVPWSDMAVLFRKNKHFALVVDAMARHDIPVEVANLGGLLSVPEIAELRAWLTVIDRPEHSPSLLQILLGSRYRLGFADIAPLTRWLSRTVDDETVDSDEVPGVTLLEAIEHLDDIEGLRPDARTGLGHFLEVYREVLTESQGASLVETCRLVLDRTRAWHDVEALPTNQRTTARLNLYRLLDLAEDWSPLKGRPSLSAFLDYLEAMEGEPAEELDSAHLSGEDAVTLVTVHRAKGLEWEVVAVPAVYHDSFPGRAQQYPDPMRFPEYVPVEHRIDGALAGMPAEEKERTDFFRRLNNLQEWRVAYVAATRARSKLILTGAYWYGSPEPNTRPAKPSELFELVESHPVTLAEPRAEEPPRPEVLRPVDAGANPDPLFDEGWDGALRRAIEDEDFIPSSADLLGVREEFDRRVEEIHQTLFDLDTVEPIWHQPVSERSVSVTGLVTYAQCPKRFYWSEIDPLPRRRNPAAVAGTDLHRRIELHLRGQIPLDVVEPGFYDVTEDTAEIPGPSAFEAFLGSKYGNERPILVEAPFVLDLGEGNRVRGRIDAVYAGRDDWEIVDFKSGRRSDDPSRLVQLQAYAVAATEVDFGVGKPERIDVTFAYLGGGLDVQTESADEPWLAEARRRLNELISGVEGDAFEPTPGPWCRHCDFLRFCDEGKKEVAET